MGRHQPDQPKDRVAGLDASSADAAPPPDLPRFMRGGPANPMGARGLYLGATLFRIHGSNEPRSIGHAVSSGCIRMHNADVINLYERVRIGDTVIVRRT
jgi:lipoprotein-anchoring transpeptidase ErfK/SrfK